MPKDDAMPQAGIAEPHFCGAEHKTAKTRPHGDTPTKKREFVRKMRVSALPKEGERLVPLDHAVVSADAAAHGKRIAPHGAETAPLLGAAPEPNKHPPRTIKAAQ